MNKCPCEQCICIPVCRHKYFKDCVLDCVLVENFLYGPDAGYYKGTHLEFKFSGNLRMVSKIVNPTSWGVSYD